MNDSTAPSLAMLDTLAAVVIGRPLHQRSDALDDIIDDFTARMLKTSPGLTAPRARRIGVELRKRIRERIAYLSAGRTIAPCRDEAGRR